MNCRQPGRLGITAMVAALSLALVTALAPNIASADENDGICDAKLSVGGGANRDDSIDVRVGQQFAVLGFGFPADTTVNIDFDLGDIGQTFETMSDSGGAFVEYFSYSGDDPYDPPELWTVTVYDPNDIGGCIDWVGLRLFPATPFTDVADSPFIGDITWLYQSGITGGCTATSFCPTATVSRGQMAAFLTRALKLPPTATDYFVDDESSIFEGDINRLAAAGITGGCTATKFCPNDPIRRDQMASFLARALGLAPTAANYFNDDEGDMHHGNINRLAESGITGGCAAGKYCPAALVTREQMAAFLHRALK